MGELEWAADKALRSVAMCLLNIRPNQPNFGIYYFHHATRKAAVWSPETHHYIYTVPASYLRHPDVGPLVPAAGPPLSAWLWDALQHSHRAT